MSKIENQKTILQNLAAETMAVLAASAKEPRLIQSQTLLNILRTVKRRLQSLEYGVLPTSLILEVELALNALVMVYSGKNINSMAFSMDLNNFGAGDEPTYLPTVGLTVVDNGNPTMTKFVAQCFPTNTPGLNGTELKQEPYDLYKEEKGIRSTRDLIVTVKNENGELNETLTEEAIRVLLVAINLGLKVWPTKGFSSDKDNGFVFFINNYHGEVSVIFNVSERFTLSIEHAPERK